MLSERKICPCQIPPSPRHLFFSPFLLTNGENNNSQIDGTVLEEVVQDVTRMTSKSIHSTLVKRIQIPPTAQSKFNSLYSISGIIDWKNINQLVTRMGAFQYKILNLNYYLHL